MVLVLIWTGAVVANKSSFALLIASWSIESFGRCGYQTVCSCLTILQPSWEDKIQNLITGILHVIDLWSFLNSHKLFWDYQACSFWIGVLAAMWDLLTGLCKLEYCHCVNWSCSGTSAHALCCTIAASPPPPKGNASMSLMPANSMNHLSSGLVFS